MLRIGIGGLTSGGEGGLRDLNGGVLSYSNMVITKLRACALDLKPGAVVEECVWTSDAVSPLIRRKGRYV